MKEERAQSKGRGRGRGAHLALAAHLVALAQALLLGAAQEVPGHDVVTQGHLHGAAAGLGLAWDRVDDVTAQESNNSGRRGGST